ncbi:RNA repair transcriptional activator RtcR [Candidatus Spyradosoma sp. SGI.093]|uniref:RNA repair transcriptional activator RtcR n=1 Tax=Candidatus Spyradosoma sp. SGI.093 TaxID=3420583 RepID=UPI003CFFC775
MKNVVVSLLGTNLDRRGGEDPFARWRPTIGLVSQPVFKVDRLHLLYEKRFAELAAAVSEDVSKVSPKTKVVLEEVRCRSPWNFQDVYTMLYDFCGRMNFDPDKESYFAHISTGTHVAQICLFLLTESRHIPGKLVQTSPDGKKNPAGKIDVIDLDLARYDMIARRFETERRDDLDFLKAGIPTRNRDFNALIETIERVAVRSEEPILLTGPTGAGKSQLARRIYELKKADGRVAGAFVDVNCATLRGDGAMSALFGHVKGAYTGAARDRAGLLKEADGGVLFLDEVGELGLDEQAMLLRAIEEKAFFPLGADREERSAFQLICGTNRDLARAVAEGRFREDLLARIDLWTFRLPALRERREDIEPNLDFELEQFCRKSGRRVTFNKEARKAFLNYALSPKTLWRANFRELNAAMTRMSTLAPDGRIDLRTVGEEIRRLKLADGNAARGDGAPETESAALKKLLAPAELAEIDAFDLPQLEHVVKVCRESRNLSEAGRALFNRSRLRKKTANDADRLAKYLARFSLSWEKIRVSAASSEN